MPGAPTPNLGLVMPAHNDFVASWDTAAANPNYTTIDAAIGTVLTLGISTTTPVNLTAAQAANWGINFTGSLANDIVVNFPTGVGGRKLLFFANVTFNGHAIFVRSATDTVGVQCLVPWALPLGAFVYPGLRVLWDDYGACPPGTVISYAGAVIPPGWQLCDGHAISQTQFDLLFGAIGSSWNTAWGQAAPGAGLFRVPDLRGVVAAGADTMTGTAAAGRLRLPGTATSWAVNVVGGADTHVLSIGEMPSHNHNFAQSAHVHGYSDPGHAHDSGWASSGLNGVGNFVPTLPSPGSGYRNTLAAGVGITIAAALANITFNAQGSGTAHTSVQPTAGSNKLIRC